MKELRIIKGHLSEAFKQLGDKASNPKMLAKFMISAGRVCKTRDISALNHMEKLDLILLLDMIDRLPEGTVSRAIQISDEWIPMLKLMEQTADDAWRMAGASRWASMVAEDKSLDKEREFICSLIDKASRGSNIRLVADTPDNGLSIMSGISAEDDSLKARDSFKADAIAWLASIHKNGGSIGIVFPESNEVLVLKGVSRGFGRSHIAVQDTGAFDGMKDIDPGTLFKASGTQ